MNKVQLAWLAGILEGEGSFVVSGGGNIFAISMSSVDRDVIATVAGLIGGNVCGPYQYVTNTQSFYRTTKAGKAAVRLSRKLYPFMSARRRAQITKARTSAQQQRI